MVTPLLSFDFPSAPKVVTADNAVIGEYYLATNLKGFNGNTRLRVQLLRFIGDAVGVITADLADAGCHLALNINQLETL